MGRLDVDLGPSVVIASLTGKASDVARVAAERLVLGYAFVDAHCDEAGRETVIVDVHVDRPTLRVHDLRAIETLALSFHGDEQPRVLALRDDFPATSHQNVGHAGDPVSLCIDDRPWVEARSCWTVVEFLVRIQTWLAKTARGELHGPARVPDPVYVHLGPSIVLSREALGQAMGGAVALGVHRPPGGDPNVLIAGSGPLPHGATVEPMIMIAMVTGAQQMGRLRHPPKTFDELADEVEGLGFDLRREVCGRVVGCVGAAWSSSTSNGPRGTDPTILSASLGVILIFPVQDEGRSTAGGVDPRAFLTVGSVLDLGVALGCVAKGPDGTHSRILGPFEPCRSTGIEMRTSLVHLAHDREIATLLSGADRVRSTDVALVGAGSVGSHVGTILAREGLFTWTVIDPDVLLPHNVVRHTLTSLSVGISKAVGVAEQIRETTCDTLAATAIVADVMDVHGDHAIAVANALGKADVILDASASVAAARHLSDRSDSSARRVSFFFNPDGTDAVILAEDAARGVTLRQVEAQYYRMIAATAGLTGHLMPREGRVLYLGACRQATNRMPEHRAALLSAAIAGELPRILDGADGQIVVFRGGAEGLRTLREDPVSWHAATCRGWRVLLGDDLIADLVMRRTSALPAETGGVLLGTVDMAARVIHVCMTLAPAPDSTGSMKGFERGISGLRAKLAEIASETSGQMSYVGEWHSHPEGCATAPSAQDLLQIADLVTIPDLNRTPALLLIVGDRELRLMCADMADGQNLIFASSIVVTSPDDGDPAESDRP